MQRRYIPAITMLSAGAVTCITCIANDIDKLLSLEILLGVLVVFYIIGIIAKLIISKVLDAGSVDAEEADSENQDNENGKDTAEDEVPVGATQEKPEENTMN